jgi:hypothetical protein
MTVLKEKVKAYWYDPANGKSFEIKGPSFNKREACKFMPEGSNSSGQNDWVLKLIATGL